MNRRSFLAGVAGLAMEFPAAGQTRAVRIQVDRSRQLGAIPPDFMGLGYEISSVADGPLSAQNGRYVNLVRRLSQRGVIRIGGNTSDYSSFATNGSAVSAPKGTVVNEENLRALGTFLDATGWNLIWGLNLGSGTLENAAAEARAVAAIAKDKLLAFEIGNEPDLFGHGAAHRPRTYGYEDYLREYRTYKAAIRRELPNAPFAGPDAASATDWVTRFASDEGNDLKLLTHHYYRECASPTSTLERLLHPDPKLTPELEKLKAASVASGVPYRICETNSLCGGGKPGVSDTFGAALWALDFMLSLAWAGAAGVNIETGMNQLGWISWYSPIGDDRHGAYSSKPEYYAMLAFAQAIRGQRLALDLENGGVNLTAYATGDETGMRVAVVNKDAAANARVTVMCGRQMRRGNLIRLTGPSLESKGGVELSGATARADGEWHPKATEPAREKKHECQIRVPAASAAILPLYST